MADIIVTTPKSMIKTADKEAEEMKAQGGGQYFRYLRRLPGIAQGSRVYYVEDGVMTGFLVVDRVLMSDGLTCDTSGKLYPKGFYAVMEANSWKWIKPLPHKGFQGFRYMNFDLAEKIEVVGGWLDPRPKRKRGPDCDECGGAMFAREVAGSGHCTC